MIYFFSNSGLSNYTDDSTKYASVQKLEEKKQTFVILKKL